MFFLQRNANMLRKPPDLYIFTRDAGVFTIRVADLPLPFGRSWPTTQATLTDNNPRGFALLCYDNEENTGSRCSTQRDLKQARVCAFARVGECPRLSPAFEDGIPPREWSIRLRAPRFSDQLHTT